MDTLDGWRPARGFRPLRRAPVTATSVLGLGLIAAAGACGGADEPGAYQPPADCTRYVPPSGDVQTTVQTALIEATPGSTICFGPGTYAFSVEVSLAVDRVRLRGAGATGPNATVFDFASQSTGAQGVLVTSDDFVMEDIHVKNTRGDGVRTQGSDGVTFRRVRVSWDDPTTGAPDYAGRENGAYALYPVESRNVLVEDCEVVGSSDAGVYVGQSSNVIIRRNRVWKNVLGIEVENTFDAEVYQNEAYDNTAGIAVFDLPGLVQKNGARTRVYDNVTRDNNRRNFGDPMTTVGLVPRGIGIIVLAANAVEIDGNTIRGNGSAGVAVVSWDTIETLAMRPHGDPMYDPYSDGVYVHGNTFEDNAAAPADPFTILIARAIDPTADPPRGRDVLWDGVVSPTTMGMGDARICVRDNGAATFANFDGPNLLGMPMTSTDATPHDCMLPRSPAVMLE
jgi:parallel beta-helix repeat protein